MLTAEHYSPSLSEAAGSRLEVYLAPQPIVLQLHHSLRLLVSAGLSRPTHVASLPPAFQSILACKLVRVL